MVELVAVSRRDLDQVDVGVAEHLEPDRFTGLAPPHAAVELPQRGDGRPVDRHDDVAARIDTSNRASLYRLTWHAWRQSWPVFGWVLIGVVLIPALIWDPTTMSPYAAIVMNPRNHAAVASDLAHRFVDFLISEEAQRLIAEQQVGGQIVHTF